MAQSRRASFERWLVVNGAEPLSPKQNELMRFRAHGILCIVYEPNRKGRQSCVPELARQAFEAWQAGRLCDLSNDPDPEIKDRRTVYAALLAIADRVKAGEDIDVDAEAAEIGVSTRQLITSLQAHGAVIAEFA